MTTPDIDLDALEAAALAAGYGKGLAASAPPAAPFSGSTQSRAESIRADLIQGVECWSRMQPSSPQQTPPSSSNLSAGCGRLKEQ